MALWQSIPFACILLPLGSAAMTSVLKGKWARRWTFFVLIVVTTLSAVFTACMWNYGESYTYMMGHFPAPWGNEIRVGVLETVSLTVFLLVILFSFLGGMRRSEKDIEPTKYNIYCILTDLTMLSLIALVYTNDLFTAFVFIEINTLAAAGLVMMRQHGRALVAGVRYMMMNLLGSSLFLIGIVILYTITGHLLMVNIHERIVELAASGQYHVPLTVVVSLISVGLAMKCALFPFDKWLPAAYSNSTPSGSAMLSSIVSKGYIFLLIKVYVRVIGFDVIRSLGICDVLFIFGAIGMVAGSVNAMRAKTTRMMVAYSSVAQIGYIFTALGLGNELGMLCALWHMLAHSATKSMLFISAHTLDHASGDTHLRKDLRGGFYRSPLAAAAFTLGAANLVGVPMLSVFVTKVTMAQAAVMTGGRHTVIALCALAISTLLNAYYFLGTTMQLYIPDHEHPERNGRVKINVYAAAGLIGFMALNLTLSFCAQGIFGALLDGLTRFA